MLDLDQDATNTLKVVLLLVFIKAGFWCKSPLPTTRTSATSEDERCGEQIETRKDGHCPVSKSLQRQQQGICSELNRLQSSPNLSLPLATINYGMNWSPTNGYHHVGEGVQHLKYDTNTQCISLFLKISSFSYLPCVCLTAVKAVTLASFDNWSTIIAIETVTFDGCPSFIRMKLTFVTYDICFASQWWVL